MECSTTGSAETFTAGLGYAGTGASTATLDAAGTSCTDATEIQEMFGSSESEVELGPVSFDGDGDCVIDTGPE